MHISFHFVSDPILSRNPNTFEIEEVDALPMELDSVTFHPKNAADRQFLDTVYKLSQHVQRDDSQPLLLGAKVEGVDDCVLKIHP